MTACRARQTRYAEAVTRFLSILLLVLLALPLASNGQLAGSERKRFDELKARADKGDAQAQLDLGMLYWSGIWVPKDLKRAAKWHRKAAEQGLSRAQYQLGLDYASGDGVEMDKVEAVAWFRRAANQGLMEAEFTLGLCYANGRGVDTSPSEAAKWYRKAAARGYLDAEAELGDCYLEGAGVTKDPPEGVKLLRHAAEKGSVRAQGKLAHCYEKGIGTPKDYLQAYKWYALAESEDDTMGADFRMNLAKLESLMTPEQVTEAQHLAHEFKPANSGGVDPSGGSSANTNTTPATSETVRTGSVNVTSEDETSEIFVDGAFVGNPPAKVKLSEGRHVIEVRKPGFKAYRRELQVGVGAELSLRALLEKDQQP